MRAERAVSARAVALASITPVGKRHHQMVSLAACTVSWSNAAVDALLVNTSGIAGALQHLTSWLDGKALDLELQVNGVGNRRAVLQVCKVDAVRERSGSEHQACRFCQGRVATHTSHDRQQFTCPFVCLLRLNYC